MSTEYNNYNGKTHGNIICNVFILNSINYEFSKYET